MNIIEQFEIYKSVKQDPFQILNEQTNFRSKTFFEVIQHRKQNKK